MAFYSAEEARKRYDSLPLEVKNLLYSPGMSFTIQEIGQKNSLHIDQIDILNTEVGQVMLGFTDSKDLPHRLMEMLNLEQGKAAQVAQDVNDMLFNKIRDKMKQVYEANKIEPTPTPVAPPPIPSIPPPPIKTPAPLSSVLPKSGPAVVPPTPASPPMSPIPPKPPQAPPSEMHQAEVMLNQKTVEIAPKPAEAPKVPLSPPLAPKPEPPKPELYKTDPYREPAE